MVEMSRAWGFPILVRLFLLLFFFFLQKLEELCSTAASWISTTKLRQYRVCWLLHACGLPPEEFQLGVEQPVFFSPHASFSGNAEACDDPL